jgi:transcriptional regulator with XRE-family HTH domain
LKYFWQITAGGVVDKILEKLKHEHTTEDARYAYADSIANAFLTSQIKALQERRGLTQEELAKLVGTQQSGISRWLNSGFSTCKVDSLHKFARAYGVRLWISFKEFGSLPEDAGAFSEKRLVPHEFDDDPAFKEPTKEETDRAAGASARMNTLGAVGTGSGYAQELAEYRTAYQPYPGQPTTLGGLTGLPPPSSASRDVPPEEQVPKVPVGTAPPTGAVNRKVVPIDIKAAPIEIKREKAA